MFTVTGLPHIHEQNKVYKFTFFDKYVLFECSDGAKRICPFLHAHIQCTLQPDRTESILFACLPGADNKWYLVPTGTFDKILENVYNFKGGNLLDLLN